MNLIEHSAESALEELEKIYGKPELVKKWLQKHLKRFYCLIPPKREEFFLRGFIEGLEIVIESGSYDP